MKKTVWNTILTKKHFMSNQFKNKWLYVLIAMVLGIVIAAWGWDKNESTIPERTHGAVAMIVTGLVLFLGAVGILFFGSSGRK